MDTIYVKIDQKKIKLGVHWHKNWINFCTLKFTKDNSLHFSSKFHCQSEIHCGISTKENNMLYDQIPEKRLKTEEGFHISLHPKGQIMHLKNHKTHEILDKRELKWHPVTKAFNLLILFSPPLDTCQPEKDRSVFFAEIPDEYKDSIRLKVDIFPLTTAIYPLSKDSIWIFIGRCPEYNVYISMDFAGSRTDATLYWPDSADLSL